MKPFTAVVPRQTRSLCKLATLSLLLCSSAPAPAGALLHLTYTGLPTGAAVSTLTNSPSFPGTPAFGVALVEGLKSPLHVLPDSSGTWTRGFVEAPQTGPYTFWIAADDNAELWLGTNSNPAGAAKIAENIGYLEFGQYNLKPAQKSAPVTLMAGQKYYFEIRHKEDFGGDHVEIMWQLPDGRQEDPIPAKRLWPYPVDLNNASYPEMAKAPEILANYLGTTTQTLEPAIVVNEGDPLELVVTVEASQPASVQWFRAGVPISGANLLSYRIPSVLLSENNVSYSVTITNTLGQTSASTVLSVMQDMTPPTLVDALTLGNPAGTIAVVFSEPLHPQQATNASNYTLDPAVTITSARMGSTPNTVLLNTTGLAVGTTYTLMVANVRDLASTPNIISGGSAVAVETDLLTWLKLDEFSGTTANDSSTFNLDGTIVGGATPGYAGKIVNSLKFDGLDDAVELPAGYSDFTGGLTFALWARPLPVVGVGWSRFIEFGNGNMANNNILFARNAQTERITFQVMDGNISGPAVTTRDLLQIDQWQHVAVTMDGSGACVVYFNGEVAATGTTTVPPIINRENCRLGRSNFTFDSYYAGYMDDVRIYRRALSAAAIRALAAGSGANDEPAVVVTAEATVPNTALSNTPPGVVTVTRTGSTGSALTVQYSMEGSAVNGTHYTNLSGSVSIPAGAASVQILVAPVNQSFTDPFRTAIVKLLATANYSLGATSSATVTIANNGDLKAPKAYVATAEGRTINVWFDEPVTLPSATNLANYVLNAGGISITNATLTSTDVAAGGYHLRVVLQVSDTVPVGTVLTVSGVEDAAGNDATYQLEVYNLLTPGKIVANEYHRARWDAFNRATDGVVNNGNNAATGFDTFDGNSGLTHFVGLLYQEAREINAIKVDLGQMFGDGGSWRSEPMVYLLKEPYDTDLVRPETHPSWVQVPARLVSGSRFDPAGDPNPSPNTPIAFDLSHLGDSEKTAYGWAVGGVAGDNTVRFLSISELRGYGLVTGTNRLMIVEQPQNRAVPEGNQAIFKVSAKGTLPISYQWQRDGLDIPGATFSSYALAPASASDTSAQFRVIITNPSGSQTSQVAVLTVNSTTAPKVIAATIDTAVDVWFSQAVGPSAADPANYQFNDPALSITGILQDAYGTRAVLALTGTRSVENLTLQVSNVQDLSGRAMAAQNVPVRNLAWPAVGVVANQYQQGRGEAMRISTNGVVAYDFSDFWATFGRDETDFAGLLYGESKVFNLIKVDFGHQFGDGGSWSECPRVFILKEPVNTDNSLPEQDPRWVEVPGAELISQSRFDPAVDATADSIPPNTPVAFDLSNVPVALRTGYGWAVGGVQGDIVGFPSFVAIGELRAFAVPSSGPALSIQYVGGEVILSWPASATGYTLYSTPSLGASANWQVATETVQAQGGLNVAKPAPSAGPKFYRLQQ